VIDVGFGPQIGEQLVTTHPTLARDGEQQQERERSALAGRASERLG